MKTVTAGTEVFMPAICFLVGDSMYAGNRLSATGSALISTLGFPALTSAAINVVDELLDKLGDSGSQVLFKGFPMKLAFSKYARNEFAGGNPRAKVGCINRGFAVFVRGRDFMWLIPVLCITQPTASWFRRMLGRPTCHRASMMIH